jgi:hypothetical protein
MIIKGEGEGRGVITQGEGGEWLGVSLSFNLPSTPYQTMQVEVPIQP